MSGNDSVSSRQLAPGSNDVSSPGGGGAMDILNNGGVVSGVVYQKLLFGTDEANATPITVYGDESTVAIDIAEDDLDDGSVIFAGGGAARGLVRDKWGKIIRTCGIAGCQYKTSGTTAMKQHKAAKHGIDVVWFSCDGCEYKAKIGRSLKIHKANVHNIDVRWHHCDQDGCDYKAKQAVNLKRHKQHVHDIDVRWHRCDQDSCDYKAKHGGDLKRHKAHVHDIDVRFHHCPEDGCEYKAKKAGDLKRHKRDVHNIY
ncbi:hypothetical protein TrST_g6466 [Triparma strigata]|uniref:C2H2-type domain-containing protein n=1 Tax=Triparma strigata TaxID=1606541 RepID=A0A9W7DUK5_9STRA|nr:hypothetical protein TrST_g6466 [Triparma strigata]